MLNTFCSDLLKYMLKHILLHLIQNHPYEISEVRNMVLALNVPLAIFSYGDKEKSQNVIIELEYKKKKIQILINQQRINLAEVEYLDLDLIESIIDTFQNPL